MAGGGVFGADVSLNRIGELLAAQRVTPNGLMWIMDASGRLVAAPGLARDGVAGDDPLLPLAAESDNAAIRAVARAVAQGGPNGPADTRLLDIDGQAYVYAVAAMPEDLGFAPRVALAAPMGDVTGHIDRMAERIVLIAAAILVLAAPLAVFAGRRAARPVRLLVGEAEKIQGFDFSPSPDTGSRVDEVQALARAFEVMKATIQSKTERLVGTQKKLETLVAGGLALSAEKDLARLATLIFQSARDIAGADGGVMYLFEDGELEVELLSLNSESLVLGGLSGNPAPRVKVRPDIMPFLSPDMVLRHACEAFVTRRTVIVRDAELSLFPTGLPDEPVDYRVRSLIATPIVTRRDEALGVIQLFNPVFKTAGDPDDAERHDLAGFIGSLAAQAAVTLDNRNLVNSLEELFDALIKVIAASIDAKSPYTGGHCTRVPVLAEMLARAVSDCDTGPMRDFRLETEDDWRQLWIAAWLHDCGKVTTPEYVVDKATKLETIYNRIHEVRARFEVLWRDAEISMLRKLAEGREDPEAAKAAFEAERGRLTEEFAFVARCNVGGECMSEADKARLGDIARRTFSRHFSDRLGISAEELRARGDEPEAALPATERVLADKPEHVSPRTRTYPDLRDARGNPLSLPDNEYHRGELYNLCIARGTLTPEERFKINEHTLSGLEMLRKIPFPKRLGRVTEIATAHHETLIGTGYPLKKTKEQLSVEGRILAIADIFEALTASDRPYKKAKPLSEALRIMAFMRDDKHIDADLFDIFLRRGVFRAYAEVHLHPSQSDVEDVSRYLSKNE